MDPAALSTLTALAGREIRGDPEARREVAREFEALLVGEMMKAASRSGFGGHLLDGGSAGRMWQEMFIDHVARAGAGRFGLAESALRALDEGSDGEAPVEEPTSSRENP